MRPIVLSGATLLVLCSCRLAVSDPSMPPEVPNARGGGPSDTPAARLAADVVTGAGLAGPALMDRTSGTLESNASATDPTLRRSPRTADVTEAPAVASPSGERVFDFEGGTIRLLAPTHPAPQPVIVALASTCTQPPACGRLDTLAPGYGWFACVRDARSCDRDGSPAGAAAVLSAVTGAVGFNALPPARDGVLVVDDAHAATASGSGFARTLWLSHGNDRSGIGGGPTTLAGVSALAFVGPRSALVSTDGYATHGIRVLALGDGDTHDAAVVRALGWLFAGEPSGLR